MHYVDRSDSERLAVIYQLDPFICECHKEKEACSTLEKKNNLDVNNVIQLQQQKLLAIISSNVVFFELEVYFWYTPSLLSTAFFFSL